MSFECSDENICLFMFKKDHDDSVLCVFTSPFLRNIFAWYEKYKSGSRLNDHGGNVGPKARAVELPLI